MLKKRKTTVYALGQYLSMSAHKARRVIDQIRGRSYEETLMILELMPYRACYPIFKLVYSAAANASYNMDSNESNLVISKAEVSEGTIVKKLKPRARGRSFPIKRPTCHISIVVKDISLDEYIEVDFLDPLRWSKKLKSKKSIRLWRIIICIVMGEYGTKNKSTRFQTWYNPRSSFPLVCTTKKLFRRFTRRSKNKRFYQELCTKKYENFL